MAFSPEFLSRLSELGNEYQRLSEDHEKLKGTENQLYEQITQLQNEVGQLKEGRSSLLSENRSLIEKLQRVTQDHSLLQDEFRELKEDNGRLSLQLTESRLETSETREQLERERLTHAASVGKMGESQEKLKAEIVELSERNKSLNKKRQDAADQLRLAAEEQTRVAEQVKALHVEKRQLGDRTKQLTEESRLLGMRIRTLTAKNKQLGEDKQHALQNMQLAHDEEKQKLEKKIRAMESAREEALAAAKHLEEEKSRLEQDFRSAEEDKRQMAEQIQSLGARLAEATMERNKLQDALNNERNIVEENKERQKIEMDKCVRRLTDEQNRLKEKFAADYRKACDEIERLTNEKQQVVGHILDFSEMHGASNGPSSEAATARRSPDVADYSSVMTATRSVAVRVVHLENTVKLLTDQHRILNEEKERLERDIAHLVQQNQHVTQARKLLAGQHARILQGIRELAEEASLAQSVLGSGDLVGTSSASPFAGLSVFSKDADSGGCFLSTEAASS
ncbi:putative plectin [Neospora caninum Liverpool]|uniref:Putative plectin n=1 Tax=Neospora caninum (strain Liverpool) TaxID=572307 RepID=F0VE50_NEOCL|nr:putative plectin [Neospora caninum Liverpool]CBZ51993.1 putative plectin [Neospora caninum Liverpool]|eukprot:XP_003882026.1 putative plectin [Neospora caninum Liverpool]